MLENIAVIIPTHNRQNTYQDIIKYWESVHIIKIIIDSTDKVSDEIFPGSFIYYHCPNQSFPEKIVNVLSNFSFEYVALCADDDYLLIDTLLSGFEFLGKNDQYSFVIGRILSLVENKLVFIERDYKEISLKIESDDIYDRTKNYFNDYQQVLWGIYKKDILLMAFRALLKANIKNDNFIEMTLAAILLYNGKGKILGEWLNVRNVSADSWGRRTKRISCGNILKDSDLYSDTLSFKNTIDIYTTKGYGKCVLDAYLGSIYCFAIKYIDRKLHKFLSPIRRDKNNNSARHSINNYISSIQWYDIKDQESIKRIISIIGMQDKHV